MTAIWIWVGCLLIYIGIGLIGIGIAQKEESIVCEKFPGIPEEVVKTWEPSVVENSDGSIFLWFSKDRRGYFTKIRGEQ